MEEKQVIKITDEELTEIRAIRERWNKFLYELGNLSYKELQIEQQVKALQNERETLLKELSEIQSKDEQLLNSIEEKYGEGDLNIQTGDFSPVNIRN